jgi:hypothetical protein
MDIIFEEGKKLIDADECKQTLLFTRNERAGNINSRVYNTPEAAAAG